MEKKGTPGPAVRCLLCDDVIQSHHRHDFKWCKCGAIGIDGGPVYTKMTGNIDGYVVVEQDELSAHNGEGG